MEMNSKKVRMLYDRVSMTPFFNDGYANIKYIESCYDSIKNWSEVDEKVLRHLFYDRNHEVATVMMGGMAEDSFERLDKNLLRQICQSVATAKCDDTEIMATCRSDFYAALQSVGSRRLHAVFNRVICSVCRDRRFVPVVDLVCLRAVEVFLAEIKILNSVADAIRPEDWHLESLKVYQALKCCLQGADACQIGVFAWCIADMLRAHQGRGDNVKVSEMRAVMRLGFAEIGYC